LAVLEYQKLPFINNSRHLSAYFAEAGGLTSGAVVEVSGLRVGKVESISLDGPRVLVEFNVDKGVRLGSDTEAAIKTKSLLGSKFLQVTPRGKGSLSGTIPLDRTRSPYQLADALGDLTSTISGLNTDQLSSSLAVLANTFQDTPPDLKVAVQGVARFSETLDKRDEQLRKLLENADKATAVLAQRSDEVVGLIKNANALMAELQQHRAALDHVSRNLATVFKQIKGFADDNRTTLKPALDRLNGALAIVDNRKDRIQQAIKGLNSYALSLGESVGSGPFFKAYVVNLLPGQWGQPFVDAAFSDLGLDPHTLLPSQRQDPAVGQPGTPPLPVPYPRTGQGGPPLGKLPDAITGKPEDHLCGAPGVVLPGPGCYPYRESLPAPPPGGPPPGPPAVAPPGLGSTPTPAPTSFDPPPPAQPPIPGAPTHNGNR
jgi:phospholipid/cholesterol/gamma-HCH transport system substrate-binding protein